MRKYIIAALAFATILAGGLTFTACDDVDDVKDLTLDRLLSPTNVTAFIRNKTNVELKWDAINGATSYTIGVFQGNPNDGASALITESTEDVTYTITGLEGETEYTFGVKSVAKERMTLNGVSLLAPLMQNRYSTMYQMMIYKQQV